MKQEIRKALACVLLAVCVMVVTGFNSTAADAETEALTPDSIHDKMQFTPLASVLEEIPEAAAVAVHTQEWYKKALANTNEEADVLAEAADGSAVIGKMYHNTIVEVLEKGEVWSKISSGSVTGYVKNEVLAFGTQAVERAKEVCPMVAKPQHEDVHLRTVPDTEGEVKGIADHNNAYPVLEQTGEWIKVQDADQNEVYVSSEFVTVERSTQSAKSIEEIQAEEEAKRLAEEEAKRAEEAAKAAEAAQAAQDAQNASVQAQTEHAASGNTAVTESTSNQAMAATGGDQNLLAAIIYCEAGNQPYEGQVAVGAVILNRVRSSVYPNTISEVIYQSGQFGPAMTGLLDQALANGSVPQSCYQAAADALAGVNPIGDAMYFGDGNNTGILIGGHWFHN